MGHYIWIPTSGICLQIGVGVCTVPTADTVETGEVNCYNFIVRRHSLPQFVETISQGYVAQCNDPWYVRMVMEGVRTSVLSRWSNNIMFMLTFASSYCINNKNQELTIIIHHTTYYIFIRLISLQKNTDVDSMIKVTFPE